MVLRQGSGPARLTGIAFQIAPEEPAGVIRRLESHGLPAELRTDDQPGIGRLVRTINPDGVAIDLFSEFQFGDIPPGGRGIDPHKLSHVAALCPDIGKTMSFYTDVLGFRFSDAIGDVFYFLRCGSDHHTINLLAGDRAALQHVAFAVADMGHIGRTCDVLARGGIETLWGPVRHGAGHNLAVYHRDPEGQIVEFCAALDVMSNEALGFFDPRPWHADRPQRPKVWDPREGAVVWGQFPPPKAFAEGVSGPGLVGRATELLGKVLHPGKSTEAGGD